MAKKPECSGLRSLEKISSGIMGLDDILEGGFPLGRPVLVVGGPGCGKTILALTFLLHGAMEEDEPGLFLSFEESKEDLICNFNSMGLSLDSLIASEKLIISDIGRFQGDLIEAGNFTLDGLFIHLENQITRIGARRVAIDTIENLFYQIKDSKTLRFEISRLFNWFKAKGITVVVTGERYQLGLTEYKLEEFISDCVLFLDHRIFNQISKRRLRVLKYRGSGHGADEYPFLLGQKGLSVLPITSVNLNHSASSEIIASGIADLDKMLGLDGFYIGSSILITGLAGTGKTTMASSFANAQCSAGHKCLYFAFEESPQQIIRNMKSVNIDLEQWIDRKLLSIVSLRPTHFGLEEHLLKISNAVEKFEPTSLVIDPITNFNSVGGLNEVKAMLTRIISFLKERDITCLMTCLISGKETPEESFTGVSSIVDSWIILDYRTYGTMRRRCIYIQKSRGMDHSFEKRELVISSAGMVIRDLPKVTPGQSRRDGDE